MEIIDINCAKLFAKIKGVEASIKKKERLHKLQIDQKKKIYYKKKLWYNRGTLTSLKINNKKILKKKIY